MEKTRCRKNSLSKKTPTNRKHRKSVRVRAWKILSAERSYDYAQSSFIFRVLSRWRLFAQSFPELFPFLFSCLIFGPFSTS